MSKTIESTVQEKNPEAHEYSVQQSAAPVPIPKAEPKEPLKQKKIELMCQHLCTQWLDGWGRTLSERALTNDPTCIPKDSWQVNGGGRGKPAGVPGILDVYLDVEAVLTEFEHRRPAAIGAREVTAFIHRDCVTHETTSVGVVFEDGTTHYFTSMKEFRESPPKNVKEIVPVIKRVQRIDWSRFRPPAAVGSDLAMYGMTTAQFFRAAYLAVREQLIEARGLWPLAIDYLDRGIRIQVR